MVAIAILSIRGMVLMASTQATLHIPTPHTQNGGHLVLAILVVLGM